MEAVFRREFRLHLGDDLVEPGPDITADLRTRDRLVDREDAEAGNGWSLSDRRRLPPSEGRRGAL